MRHSINYLTGLFLFTISCKQQSNAPVKPLFSTDSTEIISIAIDNSEKKNVDSIPVKLLVPEAVAFLNSEECRQAEERARKEAGKGNYFYTRNGTYTWDDYEKFYSEYIKGKYGVIMRANCIGSSFSTDDCFYSAATVLVKEKFGNDFEERTSAEAHALFKE